MPTPKLYNRSGWLYEKIRSERTGVLDGTVFQYLKGREYKSYIDAGARSNGHSTGDFIEEPAGIIESLLREEVYILKGITIDTVTINGANDEVTINESISNIDDFYNGAVWVNLSELDEQTVSDFVGSTGTFIMPSITGQSSVDSVYLYNVNCNIDTASFDVIGNTTNGLRKDWKFRRSINGLQNAFNLIDELLYESHCILFQSNDEIRIKALDAEASVTETFDTPLMSQGRPLISVALTPMDSLYTEFRLKYGYEYGLGDHTKEHFCSHNDSSDSTNLGSTYQTMCGDARVNYNIDRTFEYYSNWIWDDTTAAYLLQKLIEWNTEQRLVVNYTGDLKNHVKYEIGDQVLIDYADMIPTGKNNSAKFIITYKEIVMNKGNWAVNFELTELP